MINVSHNTESERGEKICYDGKKKKISKINGKTVVS